MTSTREKWLRSLLTALAAMLWGADQSPLWAQGFGADPFRPYNSQYDAYTYPMGPATPGGGQGRDAAPHGERGGEPIPGLSRRDGRSGTGGNRAVWNWDALLPVVHRSQLRSERDAGLSAQSPGGSVVRAKSRTDHPQVPGVLHRKRPQEASLACWKSTTGLRTRVYCAPCRAAARIRRELSRRQSGAIRTGADRLRRTGPPRTGPPRIVPPMIRPPHQA